MKKVLLSVAKVNEATGIDQTRIRRMIDDGQIPGIRVGRFYRIPVWWVEQYATGPAPRAVEAA